MSKIDYEEIIDTIVEEEKQEHGLTFDFHYIGRTTYYKKMEEIYKTKISKLKKGVISLKKLNFTGFQNTNKNFIVIFSDAFKRKIYPANLTKLIFVLYHEIGHAKDFRVKPENMDLCKYDNLMIFIDKYIKKRDYSYYFDTDYHDREGYEISANMYAVSKTREFFEKNKQYKLDERYLKKQESKVQSRYNSWNLTIRLNSLISDYNNLSYDLNAFLPFNIFLNQDGNFKHIDEIRTHPKFSYLDERIKLGFLMTDKFKESLALTTISEDSKQWLLNFFDDEKSRKLLSIQKHQKFSGITDVVKQNKIETALFGLINVEILYQLLNSSNLESLERLLPYFAAMSASSIYLAKDLLVKICEKYKIYADVHDIEQFINELENINEEGVKTI